MEEVSRGATPRDCAEYYGIKAPRTDCTLEEWKLWFQTGADGARLAFSDKSI